MIPSVLRKSLEMRTLSDLTTAEMTALHNVLPGLHVRDIDNCDPSFLPWLAWEWRVDVWDDAWPVEQKREVVKNALLLFKYKGTPWAVKRALDLTGYTGEVIEWHQQTPEGPRGTFVIDVPTKGGKPIDQTFYDQVFTLVESNKRGSQHWTLRPQMAMAAGMYLPVAINVCMKINVIGDSNGQ